MSDIIRGLNLSLYRPGDRVLHYSFRIANIVVGITAPYSFLFLNSQHDMFSLHCPRTVSIHPHIHDYFLSVYCVLATYKVG